MPLKSMTGFARTDGMLGSTRWHWEVRSVNGRGLDVRLRVPPGFEAIEAKAREAVTKRVARGNVSATLSCQREATGAGLRVNETALESILAVIERLGTHAHFAPARPDTILGLRGVLEADEPVETDTEQEARNRAILGSLDAALAALGESRVAEGARLAPVLDDQLAQIERLVAQVAASPARTPDAIRARLKEQLQRVLDSANGFDVQRLHQEAALIATRADVEEELKRLGAHIASARELIAAKEPVGRKLDFLMQEFNREANTLCSKSNDIEITRAGLELKAVIDQMREQVQNIE